MWELGEMKENCGTTRKLYCKCSRKAEDLGNVQSYNQAADMSAGVYMGEIRVRLNR
jgi:hypothetical protein